MGTSIAAPTTIAAIDAGSNAIRAQVGALVGNGELTSLQSERIPVRLGHRAFTLGELDNETIDAAVAAFARFRKLFDYHGVERYRAVATSATRSVRNRELLLHRIHYETGIELEVIDGEEEIRLVRLAVEHAFGPRPVPELLMDLGGGSMEVGRQSGGKWRSVSMPIGTVRLMETFELVGAMSGDEVKMLRRYIRTLLERFGIEQFAREHEELTVGTGGNADALARIFGKEREGMWTVKRDELQKGVEQMCALSIEERMKEYGVREDRAEVMAIAGIALSEVLVAIDAAGIVAPDVGVRDGLMLELAAETSSEQHELSEHAALLGAFRVFMARLGHETTHGEHVRRLATTIFDQTRELHGLDERAREVLELASLVHDLGEVVDRRAHHRHSEYLVLNGRIPGLTSPLREMVAALARAHRKSMPDTSKHDAYGSLKAEEREVIDKLVPIIRVADALDTDHRHLVQALHIDREAKRKWKLHVDPHAGESPSAETISRRNHLFERVYGVELVTEVEALS